MGNDANMRHITQLTGVERMTNVFYWATPVEAVAFFEPAVKDWLQ